ncbi:MAG: hypothetical protein HYV27_18980 [Candidatus Hydrogenedentes bacterium]|nr:hypothetical protein [Candidatus Hydrogenedentota bacterium]
MNVLLLIATEPAVSESVKAAAADTDLVLVEPDLDQAKRRLASIEVDALFIDDTVLHGLRNLAAVKDLAPGKPVVVISSRGDVISQADLYRAGADQVLVKPFAPQDVHRMLEQSTSVVRAPASSPLAELAVPGGAPALHQHQIALRWLSRAATNRSEATQLCESLLETVSDIFNLVRAAIVLDTGNGLNIVASSGISHSIVKSLRLEYHRGLMRWFDEHACLFDRHTGQDAPAAQKELRLLNGQLAAPFLQDGEVFGAIILGEKISGLNYSGEERDLLALLARAASQAIERQQKQHQVQRSESSLRDMFTDAPVGLLSVDKNRIVTMLNRHGESLLSLQKDALIGERLQRAGSAFADVVMRTLRNNEPTQQNVYDAATGRHLQVQAQPLADGGAIVSFGPLHEVHVNTEEIAYSPFWEYLSSRVAQEIKNPMVAINTFAQLLPKRYDSDDFRDAFSRVVQQEINRINNVVETLFQFARNPKLSLQKCNVNQAIRDVLHSFEEVLEARSIELNTSLDPGMLEAELDPVFFSQALQNVLQNAIDAMPAGGKLAVRSEQQNNRASIMISDTGPSISTDDAENIFLPFYSTKEQGMGLGLPIANRILQQHQGALRLVTSESGEKLFSIELPTVPAASLHTN